MTTEHVCTKESPMPIEIADKLEELGQWWTHVDAEETEASIYMDGSTAIYHCPNCGHTFSIFFGN